MMQGDKLTTGGYYLPMENMSSGREEKLVEAVS